jgi:hypothetical protein
MKKIIATLCLLASFSAMAEWVLVSENEYGTGLFVDPNIKKNGNLRMFWHIQNLKQADKQGDMSYRGVWQYDCQESRQRNMQVAAYPGPMATGQKSEEAYKPSEWVAIGGDQSSQAMYKYICSL